MKRPRRAAVVFSEVPDAQLTEWAIDADISALAELHSRYAATAARFAAVVSGRPEEAADMVAAAFALALAERTTEELPLEAPFLPTLLRETRTVALADADHGVDARQLASSVPAGTSPELLAEVFGGLTEPERSAIWLSEVAHLSPGDAGVALAVSGGTSALRWTRPRSVGLGALVTRANATLGDHRVGAVAALAAVDAGLGDDHFDAVMAGWPRRTNRVHRKVRPARSWPALAGEPNIGRLVRLGAAVVVILFALGVMLDLRDPGTAQTSEVARRLRVLGQTEGQASPSTVVGSGGSATRDGPSDPAGGGNGGSSGARRSGGQGRGKTGSSSQNKPSGDTAPGSTSSQIGRKAANGTTLGVGTSSTSTTAGGSSPGPPAGGGSNPSVTTPPSPGPGPQGTATTRPPTTSSTTRPPPASPPTTAITPPPPPDTSPAATTTTQPATTEPPSTTTTTEPPSTTTTTEPPSTTTTSPLGGAPPITLPPVPSITLPPVP